MRYRYLSMTKTSINIIVCPLLFTLFSIFSFSFPAISQIVLTDEPIPLKPAGYHIAGIQDNRTDKGKPAAIIIKNKENQLVSQAMGLEGGTAVAIKRYLDKTLVNAGNKAIDVRLVNWYPEAK